MLTFIKKHCYLNFDFSIVLIALSALCVLPFLLTFPEEYGYENGIIENIQMCVLLSGVYFSLTVKEFKKLFVFVAFFISILLLREVNCGRTLFFPVEGVENTFYKWKELKYGYLAHPIFGFYIVLVLFYFVKNKLLADVFQIFKKFRIPVLSILFFFFSFVCGIYAERKMHNLVFEEFAELLVYVFFVQILWMYSRQKVKKVQDA